jgi:hypothetical protein
MFQAETHEASKSRAGIMNQCSQGMTAVVYRSHAVRDLPPAQLDQLTLAAQARNQRESITGVMVYDDQTFFQWLEGPIDGVDRIMHSIKHDSRHTDIQILSHQAVDHRSFVDWSMKLATPAPDFVPWQSGALSPPSDVIEHLRRSPNTAPSILLKIVPTKAIIAAAERVLHDAATQMPLNRSTAALLKSVILSIVIPELVQQHRGSARPGSSRRSIHARQNLPIS